MWGISIGRLQMVALERLLLAESGLPRKFIWSIVWLTGSDPEMA